MKKLALSAIAGVILATGAFASDKSSLESKFTGEGLTGKNQTALSVAVGEFYDYAGIELSGERVFYGNINKDMSFLLSGKAGIGTNSQDLSEGAFFNGAVKAHAFPFLWDAITKESTESMILGGLGAVVKAEVTSFAHNDFEDRTSDLLVGGGFNYIDPIFNSKWEATYSQGIDNQIESEKEVGVTLGVFALNAKRTLVEGENYDSVNVQYSYIF
jgi:hypothetical protein